MAIDKQRTEAVRTLAALGKRILGKFQGVGIAFAILPIVATPFVIAGAYNWARPLIKPPVFEIEQKATGKRVRVTYESDAQLITKKIREALAPAAVPDELISRVDQRLARINEGRDDGLVHMVVGAALLVLAVGLYAACWLIGWIWSRAAPLARDRRPQDGWTGRGSATA